MNSGSSYEEKCVICGGSGVLWRSASALYLDVRCPHCRGSGIEPNVIGNI